MSFLPPHSYQIGALYTGRIRDYHRYYGVPIRESKGFLESMFYIADNTAAERRLIRTIEALIQELQDIEDEERWEEEAELRAEQDRLKAQAEARLERAHRRRNAWRRLTLRKPLEK